MDLYDFAPDDKKLLRLIEMSVDEIVTDEDELEFLCRFLIDFSFHAAPRESTLTLLKNGQVDAYRENKTEEINNNFKCHAEYLTRSDIAWTMWQYINSYPDFVYKKQKIDKKSKHMCKSRYTSDGVNRFQPDEDSEGMRVYKKIKKFVGELMRHREWTLEIRRTCNKIAKKNGLLPTWTEDVGPKSKRPVVQDSEEPEEAPTFDFDETDLQALPALPGMELDVAGGVVGNEPRGHNNYYMTLRESEDMGDGDHCASQDSCQLSSEGSHEEGLSESRTSEGYPV